MNKKELHDVMVVRSYYVPDKWGKKKVIIFEDQIKNRYCITSKAAWAKDINSGDNISIQFKVSGMGDTGVIFGNNASLL